MAHMCLLSYTRPLHRGHRDGEQQVNSGAKIIWIGFLITQLMIGLLHFGDLRTWKTICQLMFLILECYNTFAFLNVPLMLEGDTNTDTGSPDLHLWGVANVSCNWGSKSLSPSPASSSAGTSWLKHLPSLSTGQHEQCVWLVNIAYLPIFGRFPGGKTSTPSTSPSSSTPSTSASSSAPQRCTQHGF